jgi:hypothetical protein
MQRSMALAALALALALAASCCRAQDPSLVLNKQEQAPLCKTPAGLATLARQLQLPGAPGDVAAAAELYTWGAPLLQMAGALVNTGACGRPARAPSRSLACARSSTPRADQRTRAARAHPRTIRTRAQAPTKTPSTRSTAPLSCWWVPSLVLARPARVARAGGARHARAALNHLPATNMRLLLRHCCACIVQTPVTQFEYGIVASNSDTLYTVGW